MDSVINSVASFHSYPLPIGTAASSRSKLKKKISEDILRELDIEILDELNPVSRKHVQPLK
jgi:hypothetical protein